MPTTIQYFVEEPYVYGWLGAFLMFLYLTYNPTLAGTFAVGLFACFAFYIAFKPRIKISNMAGNSLRALFFGLGAFLIFTALSIVVLQLFQNLLQIDPTLNSIWALNSQSIFGKLLSSSAPVLAESKILTLVVFGFMIPFIETLLIIRAMEVFSTIARIPLELRQIKIWFVFAIVASGFVWLHIQAKGIVETAPLVLVFIFAMITCALAVYDKEAESAIYFHQINNSNAIIRTVLFGATGR